MTRFVLGDSRLRPSVNLLNVVPCIVPTMMPRMVAGEFRGRARASATLIYSAVSTLVESMLGGEVALSSEKSMSPQPTSVASRHIPIIYNKEWRAQVREQCAPLCNGWS